MNAKANNNDTFIKITNQDIYREIQSLKAIQQRQHEEVITRQDQTNGKVKRSLWIATSAMSLTILLLGFLFEHLSTSKP
jgi:hypothetical protein